jgi:predicted alpha/beta-fold hydrolase
MSSSSQFQPPRLLRNPHLQSIMASTGPRRRLVRRRATNLLSHSESILLDGGDGVRLLAELSRHDDEPRDLAVMIHGWEGSADSLYLLSCGSQLFDTGLDVLRLNLRDHGPTHHLNRELFNSTRLDEVVGAIGSAAATIPHRRLYLVGFSLGGNFALRTALRAPDAGIALDRVVAVCPVLDPVATNDNLQNGWWVYHRYFHRKWSRSLRIKLRHYPELDYGEVLPKLRTLGAMNDYFVARFTEFASTRDYLEGYALTGPRLRDLAVPSHLITSRDDPVCLVDDLRKIDSNNNLQIEVTEHGGHCGFIENWRLDSWIDRRIVALLTQR